MSDAVQDLSKFHKSITMMHWGWRWKKFVLKNPEKYNPSSILSRKGYFSIPVQDMLNIKQPFIALSAFRSGEMHESAVLEMYSICGFIEIVHLPKGIRIDGWEEYICSASIRTTFRTSFFRTLTASSVFNQSI